MEDKQIEFELEQPTLVDRAKDFGKRHGKKILGVAAIVTAAIVGAVVGAAAAGKQEDDAILLETGDDTDWEDQTDDEDVDESPADE